jgi:hypothetical protein
LHFLRAVAGYGKLNHKYNEKLGMMMMMMMMIIIIIINKLI